MARNFQFRLATLLRLRETARDERRGQLAEAYRADELTEQRIVDVGRQLDEVRVRTRQAIQPGEVELDRIVTAQRFEVTLRAQQRKLEEQRALIGQEIERRRQLLLEANRQVRVLEQLRDRQRERFDHEQARREVKQLDEVAATRVGRSEEVEQWDG